MLEEDTFEHLQLSEPLIYAYNDKELKTNSSCPNKNVSFSKQSSNNKEQEQLGTERILYFEGSKIKFSLLDLTKKSSKTIEFLEENKIKVLTDVLKLKITKTIRKGVEKPVQLNQESINISVDEKNLNIFIDDYDYEQELRQKLFNYVSIGRIDIVNSLLQLPHSDINDTYYSENLLMCAIRHKQLEMAEFLISNKIDVTYSVQLMEFPNETTLPITLQSYSCREMAYDRQLYDLVNLIDFFDETTNSKIVRYIGKNLLKIPNTLIPKSPRINFTLCETEIKQMTDEAKDYLTNPTNNLKQDSNSAIETHRESVNQTKLNRYLQSKQSLVQNSNEIPKQKELSYRGYKVKFDISVSDKEEKLERIKSGRQSSLNSARSDLRPVQVETFKIRPHTSMQNRVTSASLKRATSCLNERPKSSFLHKENKKISAGFPKLYSKQELYMKTLKKCGLANSYCMPILK